MACIVVFFEVYLYNMSYHCITMDSPKSVFIFSWTRRLGTPDRTAIKGWSGSSRTAALPWQTFGQYHFEQV